MSHSNLFNLIKTFKKVTINTVNVANVDKKALFFPIARASSSILKILYLAMKLQTVVYKKPHFNADRAVHPLDFERWSA